MSKLNIPNEYAQWAEAQACELLQTSGYTVLERNWRPGPSHKEIDIIAQKDTEVVFVEVKARLNPAEDPMDNVSRSKVRNMVACAEAYLAAQDKELTYRFDIICVTGSQNTSVSVEHWPDAFIPMP